MVADEGFQGQDCPVFRSASQYDLSRAEANSVKRCYAHRPAYSAIAAQQLSDQRRHRRRTRKLQRPEIRRYVEHYLRQYWSPDEISGRMRHDFADQPRLRVSP